MVRNRTGKSEVGVKIVTYSNNIKASSQRLKVLTSAFQNTYVVFENADTIKSKRLHRK